MSYILDALRKSETERQQQQQAGFADLPGQRLRRGAPPWSWLIGALLLINAIVGATYLVRTERPAPATAATTELPVATTAKPAASLSEIVREARAAVPDTAAQPGPARSEAIRDPAPGNAQQPPASSPTPPAAPPTQAENSIGALPTFVGLRARGELQLPDLHLDIHVYSANAAERFVFVNMSKYREDAQLSEGPRVREITPEGVVLEYRGKTFLLRRE